MKTCDRCRKDFQEVTKTQRFCSKQCSSDYHNEKNHVPITLVEKICPKCGNKFSDKNKKKIYCSDKCYSNAKAYRNYIRNGYHLNKKGICIRCKKEYWLKSYDQKYCSSECSANAQKKYLSIPQCLAEASRKLDKKLGYVRVYCPLHPKANTWGYVYEHRLIVEGMIGRQLTDQEHIHHINGKRWDNSPENLQIMTPSEHGIITAKNNESNENQSE